MRLTAYREACMQEGWSVDPRGKPRQKHRMVLAVHRMEGAEPTRLTHDFEPWSAPEYFGFPECEPYRVKIALSESAARYVRERKWSDDQAVHEHAAGSAVLEFTAQSHSEVVSWVLSFGGEVEILEPVEVRLNVAEEIKKSLNIYNNPMTTRLH
jgi:predicted DNA-binding transcriptional regulator YafY